MEDCTSIGRKWEEIDIAILVKIFQSFDIFELISGIAQVCSTWRLAACHPLLWRTLDLSVLESNFIKLPLEPYVYVDCRSDKTLTRVLKISLNLSRGSIQTLIFHFNLYVSDDQLTCTAERCPRLKRLVMPGWNRIKKTRICKAIRMWEDLESLTMPSIANPPYLMEEISRNCKNFSELKIMGPCDILFASTLAAFLPTLKVLSLRCATIWKDALIIILDGIPNLEVLNISHCLLIEVPPPPAPRIVLNEIDESILEKASRLREFWTCMDDLCLMCQRARNDEGLMTWCNYEVGLWKEDENIPAYLEKCRFLPRLNDEIPDKRNATYKERFSSLQNLVLIMDHLSSWFIFQDARTDQSMTGKRSLSRKSLVFLMVIRGTTRSLGEGCIL